MNQSRKNAQYYSRLRQARERYGLSQEYMAHLLGYASKNAYSLKERGERRFIVEEALTIARELDRSVEDLFFEEE